MCMHTRVLMHMGCLQRAEDSIGSSGAGVTGCMAWSWTRALYGFNRQADSSAPGPVINIQKMWKPRPITADVPCFSQLLWIVPAVQGVGMEGGKNMCAYVI